MNENEKNLVSGTEAKRRAAAEKQAKSKRKYTWVKIIVALCLVLCVGLSVYESNFLYRILKAVEVNGTQYSVAEYNWMYTTSYMELYNAYGDYASQIFDTTKSLKEQQYSEDMTMADYIEDYTDNSLTTVTALYDAAKEAGYEIDDEIKASIDSQIDDLKATAQSYGYDLNSYLTLQYGRGMNEKVFRSMYERYATAYSYASKVRTEAEITDADIDARYNENPSAYDAINYNFYFVDGSEEAVFEELPEVAEEAAEEANAEAAEAEIPEEVAETVAEVPEEVSEEVAEAPEETAEEANAEAAEETALSENMLKAKAVADEILAADDMHAYVAEKFGGEFTEVTYGVSSGMSEEYSAWLFDGARKDGDKTVIESSTGYYVFEYAGKCDIHYDMVSVRHILVMPEDTEDEASWAEAKTKAEEYLKTYNDLGGGENNFANVAMGYSQDEGSKSNGGLIENMTKGQTVKEFNDWSFDPARKEGDVEIIRSSYGYHIMYFVGVGEDYYTHTIDDVIRTEKYDEFIAGAIEGYESKDLANKNLVGQHL